ncbi:hypothetical protein [Nocardia sp. NPDC003345]
MERLNMPGALKTGVAATSIAAACLIGTAATATAAPQAAPAPEAVAEAGTGSAMVDTGSAAAQSAVGAVQRGDIFGILALLVITPFQALTGGVCDLASGSALPNPCSPVA